MLSDSLHADVITLVSHYATPLSLHACLVLVLPHVHADMRAVNPHAVMQTYTCAEACVQCIDTWGIWDGVLDEASVMELLDRDDGGGAAHRRVWHLGTGA